MHAPLAAASDQSDSVLNLADIVFGAESNPVSFDEAFEMASKDTMHKLETLHTSCFIKSQW